MASSRLAAATPTVAAAVPSSAGEALATEEAGLGCLAEADVAEWPADALAGCLRALGRAEPAQLAVRSRVISMFNAQGGFEADGQPTVRTWLRWQTQITNGASHGAMAWMRRLAVHPRVCTALGPAQVTASFAGLICGWSDLLALELRDEADEILLAGRPGPRTRGRPPSGIMTRWRRRAGGWSPGACPTRLDCWPVVQGARALC
jgi:hypothetical protein